jgi:hypothetical protein
VIQPSAFLTPVFRAVILFYELDLTMKWSGILKSNPDRTIKGTLQVPYISEENDDDDFEVRISLNDEFARDNNARTLEETVRAEAIAALKQKIPSILGRLKRGVCVCGCVCVGVNERENYLFFCSVYYAI